MAVILANGLLRMSDLNPLVRNNNIVGDHLQNKAGPQGIARDPLNDGWRMFFEAVGPFIGGDGTTGVMTANGSALQAWKVSPNQWVCPPLGVGTWEANEFSPSSAWWDWVNNRWIIWCHGGNNSGARQIGVAYSVDGAIGKAFVRDPLNPILTKGTTGDFDDNWVADIKIHPLKNGTYLGFYRGIKTGGPAFGTIGRVTGSAPNVLTKSGQVIANGGAGTWNEKGVNAGDWVEDPDGRLHMFVAGWDGSSNDSIGLYYSDDQGVTWTPYAGNPVLSPTGVVGDIDKLQAGDVVQGIDEGDVLFVTYGAENNVDYPTNPPISGICGAITPYRKTAPLRTGKFYLAGGYTSISCTSALSTTVFSLGIRFRKCRTARGGAGKNAPLWTELAAFNEQLDIRMGDSSGAGGGTIFAFVRTPTASTGNSFISKRTYDDGEWHELNLRRLSTNQFELWIDNELVATDTTTVGTTASVTTKAVGNWDPATGTPDGPFLGTISDAVLVLNYALSQSEWYKVLNSRTFPSGISATLDFPTAGTDSGTANAVALVEATPITFSIFASRPGFPAWPSRLGR